MNKKHILIQNEGEIETNSFELIGASTKRGESGKIGFFGSGLKYSIAYMMRKGIEFRVFSGMNELRFTTSKESLKGKDFERICINGKETSYTITMGPTWTKDWFVLREIYCNALDEGSCILVKSTEEVRPSEGKTRIYVELTTELDGVISQWDSYFADERTPLFSVASVYTCYLGSSDGGVDNPVRVYPKTSGTLYRRGIRVSEDSRLLFDYDCHNVDINEDRTAKHPGALAYAVVNLFGTFANEGYIKTVLRSAGMEKQTYEYQSLHSSDLYNGVSEKWVDFSKQNLLVVRERSGKYADHIESSKKEVFQIPSLFCRALKSHNSSIEILGMGAVIGRTAYTEVEMTPKIDFLLKAILGSLKEMKYEVPYEISIVDFDEEKVMGQADIENKRVLIGAQTFDMGRREIAATIMEECEHIRSGYPDECRAFETHIFSQWLKSMEEANGLFL